MRKRMSLNMRCVGGARLLAPRAKSFLEDDDAGRRNSYLNAAEMLRL